MAALEAASADGNIVPLAQFIGSLVRKSASDKGCSLPSRMIVPKAKLDAVMEAIRKAEPEIQPGPVGSNAYLGPVVNKTPLNPKTILSDQHARA